MTPTIEAPRERKCSECIHYGFKRFEQAENTTGMRSGSFWVYCFKKEKWFPDNIEKPGERKGCEEWQ